MKFGITKIELLGTKKQVNIIGRFSRMLLNVMINKII